MPIPDVTLCPVAAGTYPIGNRRVLFERPEHEVTLRAFRLAETTVTNGQYGAFIAAGGYANAAFWTTMGWRWKAEQREPGFWRDTRYNAPDQPVVGVCWYEAVAFTRWLSAETGMAYRLPTEVEWEAAARGVDGEAPRPRNYNTAERQLGAAWAVTTRGNIAWCGAADMVGNVWEWSSSRWGRNWQKMDYGYPYNASGERESLEGSHARILRGGSWFDTLEHAAPTHRGRYLPGSRGSNIGFRVAMSG